MKKMWLCVSGVLLLALMGSNAHSEADGPDYWQVHGVEKGDVLNIRKKADWNSEKIDEIPPDGQCIKNIKCIGGLTFEEFATLPEAEKEKIKKERPRWCLIEYKGTRGWVAGRYLREGACQEASGRTDD